MALTHGWSLGVQRAINRKPSLWPRHCINRICDFRLSYKRDSAPEQIRSDRSPPLYWQYAEYISNNGAKAEPMNLNQWQHAKHHPHTPLPMFCLFTLKSQHPNAHQCESTPPLINENRGQMLIELNASSTGLKEDNSLAGKACGHRHTPRPLCWDDSRPPIPASGQAGQSHNPVGYVGYRGCH